MKKTAIIIMILTIFVKIAGFAREITLSYFYGVSGITDAYLVSLTIPSTIFAFIGKGILTSYIPIYNEVKSKFSNEKAIKFTSNLINIILIFSIFMTTFIFIFAKPIVKLFASGFVGATLDYAVLFTRVGVLSISFSSLIFIFNGYLQVNNYFFPTVLSGIPAAVFVIISIIFSSYKGYIFLSIGSALSVAIQFIYLLPYIKRTNFCWEKFIDLGDIYLRKMLKLSIPVIIGVSVNQINVLVDRTIASNIAVGGISALTYANRLNLFIQGIFVLSISTVFYPIISKIIAENSMMQFKKILSGAVNGIVLLVVPTTIGSMIFSKEIISLLFERGAFGENALTMTSVALFFYSIGMVGFGLREIISRVFYAMQDTKTPMINAAIGMILNIILNIILSRYLGIGGLALATSISGIFTTYLLFKGLKSKIGSFGMKNMLISFMKIFFASSLMGVGAKISFTYISRILSVNTSLLLSIIIGGIIYVVIIYVMRIDDVEVVVSEFKRKFSKKYKLK